MSNCSAVAQVCVCEREGERERERERLYVCVCVCVGESGGESVCVCEREGERERLYVCVCACVRAFMRACVRACVRVCGFSKSALGEHMVHALISRCVCVTVPLSVLSELNRYETQHFVSQIFTFNLDEKNRAICAAVTPGDPCCSRSHSIVLMEKQSLTSVSSLSVLTDSFYSILDVGRTL